MAIPIARKHAAASKGATGPRLRVSTSRFPNNPEIIATRPFPRNIALEKVSESHCRSKFLYRNKKKTRINIHHQNGEVDYVTSSTC